MATQRPANERPESAPGELPTGVLIGLLALAYFALARGWLAIADEEALAAAVAVPAGLALAVVVVFGYRTWPAIALGAFAAFATADPAPASAAGIAAGYTFAGLAGAYALARAGFDPRLRRFHDVAVLGILAAVASTAISASFGVATLWADGALEAGELWPEWRAWWLGDLTGVLVIAAATLVLADLVAPGRRRRHAGGFGVAVTGGNVLEADRRHHRLARAVEALGIALALAALGMLAIKFGAAVLLPVFGLIVLAALRFLQPGAVLIVAAVTGLAIWATAAGDGGFASTSASDELLRTQMFIALAALVGLLVAAMRTEWERAEAALKRLGDSESALAEAQRVANLGSWEWELEGGRVRWSDELYRLLGLRPDSHAASYDAYIECIHPDDRDQVERAIVRAIERPEPLEVEHRIVRPDGDVRTLKVDGRVDVDPNGAPIKVVGTAQDVTEHRVAQARFRDLLESAPDAMVILNDEGEIMLVNSQTEELFGYERDELLGRSVDLLIADRSSLVDPDHPTLFNDHRPAQAATDGDRIAVRKDGTEIPVDVSFNPLRTSGQLLFVGAIRDVTERKLAERRLQHMALHDPLTGLPNRNLFLDRLEHALARSVRPEANLAVLFCDIDNFKKINDGLGHEAGDELLTALPPRLGQALRAADTVARFGGDEFVILCEDLESEADAIRIAERIAEALRSPFVLDGNEHHMTVSVGIVFVRGGRASAPEVLRDADVAMYRAKGRGKGRFELFDSAMRARAIERLEIEKDLRRAIREDELRLVYQPVVSLKSARFVSAEALLRWEDPGRGLLAPPEFIDVAEDTGLIVPVGGWVIHEACRHAAAWSQSRSNGDRLAVSINLSPRQVSDWNIVDLLGEAVADTGVDPTLVELEITERALVDDGEATLDTLQRLKEMGIRLILDDFGTGHSSLSRLKRFPIDALKIDREFIAGISDRSDDTAIVSAVLSMAWALEVDVVAEGVETTTQLDWLSRHGCRFAQGFLISPPLTVDQLGRIDTWDRGDSQAQPAR